MSPTPEMNANPSKQLVATPKWVKIICPPVPDPLPFVIIGELEEAKQQAEREYARYASDNVEIFRHSISICMNNFHLKVIDRAWKDPNKKPRMPAHLISDVLRDKTWGEFNADIDDALKRTGWDVKAIEQLSKIADSATVNATLLPAFVLLRQQGYKRYPDLAI